MGFRDAWRSYVDAEEQRREEYEAFTRQNAVKYRMLGAYGKKPQTTLAHVRQDYQLDPKLTDVDVFNKVRNTFPDYDDDHFEEQFGHLRPEALRPAAPEEPERSGWGRNVMKSIRGLPVVGQIYEGARGLVSGAETYLPSMREIGAQYHKDRQLAIHLKNALERGVTDEQARNIVRTWGPDRNKWRKNPEEFESTFGDKSGPEIYEMLVEQAQKTIPRQRDIGWERYESKRPEEGRWHPDSIAYAVGDSIGRMSPLLVGGALAPVTGGVSLAAGGSAFAANVYGSALKEGEDMGLDAEARHDRALFQTIAEVGTEAIPLGIFFKGVKGLTRVFKKEVATREAVGMLRRVTARMGESAVAEGIQESFVEIANATYDKLNEYEDRSMGEFLHDLGYAAVLGGLTGATLGGAIAPFQRGDDQGIEGASDRVSEKVRQGKTDSDPEVDPEVEEAINEEASKTSSVMGSVVSNFNNLIYFDENGAYLGSVSAMVREGKNDKKILDGYQVRRSDGTVIDEFPDITSAKKHAEENEWVGSTHQITKVIEEDADHKILESTYEEQEEGRFNVITADGVMVASGLDTLEEAQAAWKSYLEEGETTDEQTTDETIEDESEPEDVTPEPTEQPEPEATEEGIDPEASTGGVEPEATATTGIEQDLIEEEEAEEDPDVEIIGTPLPEDPESEPEPEPEEGERKQWSREEYEEIVDNLNLSDDMRSKLHPFDAASDPNDPVIQAFVKSAVGLAKVLWKKGGHGFPTLESLLQAVYEQGLGGTYNRKTLDVVINLRRYRTRKEIEKTIGHEVIGHSGFLAVIGDKWSEFKDEYNRLKKEASPLFKELKGELDRRYTEDIEDTRSRFGTDEALDLEIMEFVAIMQEKRDWHNKKDGRGPSQAVIEWFNKLVQAVQEWFNRPGGLFKTPQSKFELDDIYDILGQAERYVQGDTSQRWTPPPRDRSKAGEIIPPVRNPKTTKGKKKFEDIERPWGQYRSYEARDGKSVYFTPRGGEQQPARIGSIVTIGFESFARFGEDGTPQEFESETAAADYLIEQHQQQQGLTEEDVAVSGEYRLNRLDEDEAEVYFGEEKIGSVEKDGNRFTGAYLDPTTSEFVEQQFKTEDAARDWVIEQHQNQPAPSPFKAIKTNNQGRDAYDIEDQEGTNQQIKIIKRDDGEFILRPKAAMAKAKRDFIKEATDGASYASVADAVAEYERLHNSFHGVRIDESVDTDDRVGESRGDNRPAGGSDVVVPPDQTEKPPTEAPDGTRPAGSGQTDVSDGRSGTEGTATDESTQPEGTGRGRRSGTTRPVGVAADEVAGVSDRPQGQTGNVPGTAGTDQQQEGADTGDVGGADDTGVRADPDAADGGAVTYEGKSGGKSTGAVLPKAFQEATQEALDELEDEVGNFEEFIEGEFGDDFLLQQREELPKAKQRLQDVLSQEQIDAFVMQLKAFKDGDGFINGFGTGVGKGRIAAITIRWAQSQGKIPIFFTVGPTNFSDMYNDLVDIGVKQPRPMFVASQKVLISDKRTGEVVYKQHSTPTTIKRNKEYVKANGKMPPGYDAIFITYKQVERRTGDQRTMLEELKRKLDPDQYVFILDESHNASQEVSGTPVMTIERTRYVSRKMVAWLSDLIGRSPTVFLSATWLKKIENIYLYIEPTKLREWFSRWRDADGNLDFVEVRRLFRLGGERLRAWLTTQLLKSRQMMRMERSMEDAKWDTASEDPNTPEGKRNMKYADQISQSLLYIAEGNRVLMGRFNEIKKAIRKRGAVLMNINGQERIVTRLRATRFEAKLHEEVKKLLVMVKYRQAANQAIEALQRGEKPIIAMENTYEAFLEDFNTDPDKGPYVKVSDITFQAALLRSLFNSLKFNVMFEDEAEGMHEASFSLEEDAPNRLPNGFGYPFYKLAENYIRGLDFDLPVSPIDAMRALVGQHGTVAEITGRQNRIEYGVDAQGNITVEKETFVTKPSTARRELIDNFNAGKIDALIMNKAGSTGISLHASEHFKDQKPRRMIIIQPASDINIYQQMLGRINRMGQVTGPLYTVIKSNVPVEQRQQALLDKKLASLSALTTADAKKLFQGDEIVDFINDYGDRIVNNILLAKPSIREMLGITVSEIYDASIDIGTGASNARNQPDIQDISQRVLGRAILLPIKEQAELIDAISEEYVDFRTRAIRDGTYQLDTATVRNLRARIRSSTAEIVVDGQTVLTKHVIDALLASDTPSPESVLERLEGANPEHNEAIVEAKNERHRYTYEEQEYSEQELLALRNNAREEYYKDRDDPQEEARFKRMYDVLDSLLETGQRNRALLRQLLAKFQIGDHFIIPGPNGRYGAVITDIVDYQNPNTKNAWTPKSLKVKLAVTNNIEEIEMSLLDFARELDEYSRVYRKDGGITRDTKRFVKTVFKPLEVKEPRELRVLYTGNMLQAVGRYENQGTIINFNDAAGNVYIGYILNKGAVSAHRGDHYTNVNALDHFRWFSQDEQAQYRSDKRNITIHRDGEHARLVVMSRRAGVQKNADVFQHPNILPNREWEDVTIDGLTQGRAKSFDPNNQSEFESVVATLTNYFSADLYIPIELMSAYEKSGGRIEEQAHHSFDDRRTLERATDLVQDERGRILDNYESQVQYMQEVEGQLFASDHYLSLYFRSHADRGEFVYEAFPNLTVQDGKLIWPTYEADTMKQYYDTFSYFVEALPLVGFEWAQVEGGRVRILSFASPEAQQEFLDRYGKYRYLVKPQENYPTPEMWRSMLDIAQNDFDSVLYNHEIKAGQATNDRPIFGFASREDALDFMNAVLNEIQSGIQFSKQKKRGILHQVFRSVSKQQIDQMVADLNISGEIQVHVYESADEVPEHLQKTVSDPNVAAFRKGNEVYIIADRQGSKKQAKITLAHEIIGHIGFDNVIGRQSFIRLRAEYKRLKQENGLPFQRIYTELIARYGVNLDIDTEMREFIALMAERRGWQYQSGPWVHIQQWFKKIVAAVYRFVRTKGRMHKDFAREFSINDIYAILSLGERTVHTNRDFLANKMEFYAPTIAYANYKSLHEYWRETFRDDPPGSDGFLLVDQKFTEQSERVQSVIKRTMAELKIEQNLEDYSWQDLLHFLFSEVMSHNAFASLNEAEYFYGKEPRLRNSKLYKLGEELAARGIAGVQSPAGNLLLFEAAAIFAHRRAGLLSEQTDETVDPKPNLVAEAEIAPDKDDRTPRILMDRDISDLRPSNTDMYLAGNRGASKSRQVPNKLAAAVRRMGREMRKPAQYLKWLGTQQEWRILDDIFSHFNEKGARHFLERMGIAGSFELDATSALQYTRYPNEVNSESFQMLFDKEDPDVSTKKQFGSPKDNRSRKSIWQVIKGREKFKFFFMRHGRMPKEVAETSWRIAQGMDNYARSQIDLLNKKLDILTRRVFKKSMDKLDPTTHEKILKALAGEIDPNLVTTDPDFQEHLALIRETIDTYSEELLEQLSEEATILRQAIAAHRHQKENTERQGELEVRLKRIKEQAEAIVQHQGHYVHRTYRTFHPKTRKRWIESVVNPEGSRYQSHFVPAAEYMAELYLKVWRGKKVNKGKEPDEETLRKARVWADNKVSDFITRDAPAYGESTPLLMDPKKREIEDAIGKETYGILLKRKNITPEIRKAMGEFTNPLEVIELTIQKQAQLASDGRFQLDLYKNFSRPTAQGLPAQIYLIKPRHGEPLHAHVEKIPRGDELGLLEGMWINKDIWEQIRYERERWNHIEGTSFAIYRLATWPSAISKVAATVWNVTTHARNFIANISLMAMSNIPVTEFLLGRKRQGYVKKLFRAQVLGKVDEDFKLDYQRMMELRVVGDGIHGRQTEEYIRQTDIRPILESIMMIFKARFGKNWQKDPDLDRIIRSVPKFGLSKMHDFMQRMYSFEDDAPKMGVYFHRLDQNKTVYKNRYKNDQERRLAAAQYTSDTMPSFSMLPDWVRGVSRFPLFGPFVSFHFEALRTWGVNVKYLKQEMMEKETRKEVFYPHLARFSVITAINFGVLEAKWKYLFIPLAGFLLGIDDLEEYERLEEAGRELLPEWAKYNKNLIVGFNKEDNTMTTFNYGAHLPQQLWLQPFYALLHRDNITWDEKVAEFMFQSGEPLFTGDIFYTAMIQAVMNKDDRRQEIWRDTDTPVEVLGKSLKHTGKSLIPGTGRNLHNVIRYFEGKSRRSGQRYTPWGELAGMAGWRNSQFDLKDSIKIAGRTMKREEIGLRGDFYRYIYPDDYQAVPRPRGMQGLRNEYLEKYRKHQRSQQKVIAMIEAAKLTGMDEKDIMLQLKFAALSNQQIRTLVDGQTIPFLPSKSSLAAKVRTAEPQYPPVYVENFRNTRRIAAEIIAN